MDLGKTEIRFLPRQTVGKVFRLGKWWNSILNQWTDCDIIRQKITLLGVTRVNMEGSGHSVFGEDSTGAR